MTRLIAVTGSAPGMGKTTVCDGLRERLTESGLGVEFFAEEHVLTHPEFAAVAAGFRATGVVAPETLLAATSGYVDSLQRSGVDVAIADALVPFVHSLMAWGHDEAAMSEFLTSLAGCLMPVRPLIIYLDGEPRTALARAAEREGPGWLDWFVGKLARYQVRPPVRDFDTACAYLETERAMTIRLIFAQPWRVDIIERAGDLTPDAMASRVADTVAAWLAGD